jgi:hypothetical protein
VGALTFLCHWGREGVKNSTVPAGAMDMSVIIVLRGVRVPVLGGRACLVIIMSHMTVVVDPAAAA